MSKQPYPLAAWQAAKRKALPILGARLRYHRLRNGLTVDQVAFGMRAPKSSFEAYELGRQTCPLWRIPAMAAAIGIPVAQLFTDDLVLAEVRVSPETLELVRQQGEPAARAAAERITAGLAARLYAEAWTPEPDTSFGARPKRRRNRVEVLAGVRQAREGSARNHSKPVRAIA